MSTDGDSARSFAPIEGAGARVLILGSMPGRQSLHEQRYYAHPRNAFWPIMAKICGFSPEIGYFEAVDELMTRGVAVWDVFAACERPGSLDAAIRRDSVILNDLGGLLHRQPGIRQVCCNGQTAARAWRSAAQGLPQPAPRCSVLPSTSPAYAAMSTDEKFARWRAAIAPHLRPSSR